MDLGGKKILVSRLQKHAEPLVTAIKQHNGVPICQPLYAIESNLSTEQLKNVEQKARQAQIGIFISRNAIEFIMPILNASLPWTWVTIGEATATCLGEYGVQEVVYATQKPENSTNMLACLLDYCGTVAEQKIMIFTGNDSDPWLANELRSLGATVEVFEVYKRCAPTNLQIDPTVDIILITCVTSLQNLYAVEPDLDLPILAASERISRAALEMGYSKVYTSKGMAHEDLLFSLSRVKDAD